MFFLNLLLVIIKHKIKFKIYISISTLFVMLACKTQQTKISNYETENLKIERLTENTWLHISYLNTENYGKVACNGLIAIDDNQAIVFDTPTNDTVSLELIKWIQTIAHCELKAVVATHFHDDCLGGLSEFHKMDIPSFADNRTIGLAKSANMTPPQNGFDDYYEIMIGNKIIISEFLGEGHTKDNIISYFPSEKVLFGGCLIKAKGAGKGNLNDANIIEWSSTVEKIKSKYEGAQFVIPGHGKVGGINLLDYTIEMFKNQ